MANRWGEMEKMTDFIFLDSKSTVDGDSGHEIKTCLLLWRKAMTNLDGVLKCIFSINPILFNHTYIHLKILAKVVSGWKDNEWFTVLISIHLCIAVQSLSRVWLFVTPWNAACRAFPVLHHLSEFAQTHVHQVGDAIQPSHPMSSPSPPALNPSQHQSLFQWVNSSQEMAKVL